MSSIPITHSTHIRESCAKLFANKHREIIMIRQLRLKMQFVNEIFLMGYFQIPLHSLLKQVESLVLYVYSTFILYLDRRRSSVKKIIHPFRPPHLRPAKQANLRVCSVMFSQNNIEYCLRKQSQ